MQIDFKKLPLLIVHELGLLCHHKLIRNAAVIKKIQKADNDLKLIYKKGIFDKAQSTIVVHQVLEVVSKHIAIDIAYSVRSKIWQSSLHFFLL